MKNRWRTAFWTLTTIFIFATAFLLITIFDQNSTITFMKEEKFGTENDLEQISEIINGKLTFSDFKQISDRYPDLEDSTSLGLNQIKVNFGTDGKLKSITTIW